MDLIVTGGRNYSDVNHVKRVLDLFDYSLLVHGGATGADSIGAFHAQTQNIETKAFRALWAKHGAAAGPIRNKEMLTAHPNAVVVAFPGGKGTADCVAQAKKLGMIVLEATQSC